MEIKLSKSDLYLVLLFLVFAIPITLSDYDYSGGLLEPIIGMLLYVFFTLFVAYLIVYVLFPYFFPKKKLFVLFLVTIGAMMICGVAEIILHEILEIGGFSKIRWEKFFTTIKQPGLWIWGIIASSQNAGILIGILLGKKFYEAQMTIQEKEKEKKENELRLLKSQMDPHFLFNNLNTVDSLIDSNPEVAKKYIQKLSNLYRYLIRTKDDEVVLLDEELTFVRDYIYLLEQRYGSTYTFQIKSDQEEDALLIPPGALQTLLENVVKHNEGQSDMPINTTISIEEDTISVSNNKRLKGTPKESFGVGLSNLKARYALLTDQAITIKSDKDYVVMLPQLKTID